LPLPVTLVRESPNIEAVNGVFGQIGVNEFGDGREQGKGHQHLLALGAGGRFPRSHRRKTRIIIVYIEFPKPFKLAIFMLVMVPGFAYDGN